MSSVILTYRKPKSALNRLINTRPRSISSSVPPPPPPSLLHFDALPAWHQDNHLIHTSYRPISNSLNTCLSSLFTLHNETLNIWTHLLPALFFTVIGQPTLQLLITSHYPLATLADRLIFALQLTAAITTMTLSSCYHTLMSHSEAISSLWLRIDYVGILTLILGSFFSGIYVGFYCDPRPRTIYWTMIILLSAITSTLVLHPTLQGRKHRLLRTTAFIATGLSGFAPIGHGLYMYGWSAMWIRSGMPYWFLEGLMYGLGAFFFVTSVPESIWPGKFDVWGGSHQMFHVLVVVASLCHLWGVWEAFGWSYTNQRTCSRIF